MKTKGTGRIVAISSRAGLATSLTGIQSYPAAKHGQIGLVKQLAQELGPFGITVNTVAPGFLVISLITSGSGTCRPTRSATISSTRLRCGAWAPQDIANAVTFLASDHASWITGQTIPSPAAAVTNHSGGPS